MTMDRVSILAAWREWQSGQRLSVRTIDERERVIVSLLDHAGAGPLALTPEHIMAFVGRRDIGTNSAGTYHASIRAYCKWLVRTERRADDPSFKTPTPKRVRGFAKPISDADLAGLLAVVNRRRTRMMVLLGALAGLRVHEIAKFHGRDLDRVNGSLTVTGKGGSTELVPAHEAILVEAAGFPVDGYWFTSYEAQTDEREHITRAAVYGAIAYALRRAGIAGTPHMLRHWYGTALLDSGVDIRIVQEMMRHKSIATTQLYTRVRFARMVEASRLLHLPRAA